MIGFRIIQNFSRTRNLVWNYNICQSKTRNFWSFSNKKMSIKKTDEEWKTELTPEQFDVARKKGTEAAFTGKYNDHKEKGTYACVCCGAELFTSETKYDSGSGWPSFYQVAGAKEKRDPNTNVAEEVDNAHGMERVEVMCKKCSAHLGHVFDDGPNPTGLRYCINSTCLKFEPKPTS